MKHFILSGILGLIAMGLINFTTVYTSVWIPVSVLSIVMAGALGIPGVILVLLLQLLL